ncbi:MAG: hypothetical protein LAN62_09100, partial [Acidobacteriia bacterium]|nr:hypothetical protein [Terriglobia bacterium]
GADGLTEAHITGPNGPRMLPRRAGAEGPFERPDAPPPPPEIEVPTFRAANADPNSWIKPGDEPLTFRTTGQQKNVTLAPINRIFDKRYSVYWQVS